MPTRMGSISGGRIPRSSRKRGSSISSGTPLWPMCGPIGSTARCSTRSTRGSASSRAAKPTSTRCRRSMTSGWICRPASGSASGSSSVVWSGHSKPARFASLRLGSMRFWWSKKNVRCSSTRSRRSCTTGAMMFARVSMASSTRRMDVAGSGRRRAGSGCCRRRLNFRRPSSLGRSVHAF